MSTSRAANRVQRQQSDLKRAAFSYNERINYQEHINLIIGSMSVICKFCRAKRYSGEAEGICCSGGKVRLPPLSDPPTDLLAYMRGDTAESDHFLNNIKMYNSCFEMTSFHASNIVSDRQGFFPTFKLQGQIYHKAGPLLSPPDVDPSFIQIYFTGNEDLEAELRCSVIPGSKKEIVLNLQRMLHSHNRLVSMFKTALNSMPTDDCLVKINADDDKFEVINGTEYQRDPRDIVLQRRGTLSQIIYENHRLYDALQYPLIFWEGDDGYHLKYFKVDPVTNTTTNSNVSAQQFYSYRLMVRDGIRNHILECRQLFNQFVVDMYVKIESKRLLDIMLNQERLQVDEYIPGDGNVADEGRRVVLPSSFTGSPKHMQQYAEDALAYVQNYGRPALFITFTCNSEWPEIQAEMINGQKAMDRHDIVARVFRQKLLKLIDILKNCCVFGELAAWLYTIEWQRKGMVHSHILIWTKEKIRPYQVDSIISAEIPDPTRDPVLHAIIARSMIHGPCGPSNPTAVCMENGTCSKKFPKAFITETQSVGDGYPLYRRRRPGEGGFCVQHTFQDAEGNYYTEEVDNRWVVPYCPLLSKAFNAHINVEYCNSVKLTKNIIKYVCKGNNMAVFTAENEFDEVNKFQMGRYISSNEAIWRILSFPIHDRYPAVERLFVHLENGQREYFIEENARNVVDDARESTLTAFFKLCQDDVFAKTLLYREVPKYYTWNKSAKQFRRRKQGTPVAGYPGIRESDNIGRVHAVHPSNAECFYLRLLLFTIRGPTSFLGLKTVNGQLCETYREACEKHGLLENDQHWLTALSEASVTRSPFQLRSIFATIVSKCAPSNPEKLWEDYKEAMSEDVLREERRCCNDDGLGYSPLIFNKTLNIIARKCLAMTGQPIEHFGLEAPNCMYVPIKTISENYLKSTSPNQPTMKRSSCIPDKL